MKCLPNSVLARPCTCGSHIKSRGTGTNSNMAWSGLLCFYMPAACSNLSSHTYTAVWATISTALSRSFVVFVQNRWHEPKLLKMTFIFSSSLLIPYQSFPVLLLVGIKIRQTYQNEYLTSTFPKFYGMYSIKIVSFLSSTEKCFTNLRIFSEWKHHSPSSSMHVSKLTHIHKH